MRMRRNGSVRSEANCVAIRSSNGPWEMTLRSGSSELVSEDKTDAARIKEKISETEAGNSV